MSIKNSFALIMLMQIALIFTGCSGGNKISNPKFDEYQPIYKDNGGRKLTTVLNKNKVQQEKEFMSLLNVIHDLRLKNRPSLTDNGTLSEVDKQIENALVETESQVRELEKKIRNINISNPDSHEQVLKYMKELNDLLCGRVGAINKFLNKRINKIYGDISFKIGSSEISPKGVVQIETIISQLIADVSEWRNYVNDCNQKVFENDLFVLVVDIDGFADQQGSASTNLKLSEERANSVKGEMLKQLSSIVVKNNINIVFDKIYSKGYGEKIPPSVQQKGVNDPNRRICIINSIVGPTSLLKN